MVPETVTRLEVLLGHITEHLLQLLGKEQKGEDGRGRNGGSVEALGGPGQYQSCSGKVRERAP